MSTSWLPPLLRLEDYDGDWRRYIEAVHARFARDFEGVRPDFRGKRMGLKRHPELDGWSATFWHMVSEGAQVDADRTPDLRRCERIAWPLEIIRAADDPARVCSWTEGSRIHLALTDFSYLVVLDERADFVMPWTAFTVEQEHRREKLKKRWKAAQKS